MLNYQRIPIQLVARTGIAWRRSPMNSCCRGHSVLPSSKGSCHVEFRPQRAIFFGGFYMILQRKDLRKNRRISMKWSGSWWIHFTTSIWLAIVQQKAWDPCLHAKKGWQMKVQPIRFWKIIYCFVDQYYSMSACSYISPLYTLIDTLIFVDSYHYRLLSMKSLFFFFISPFVSMIRICPGMLMHAPPASVDFSLEVDLIPWRHPSLLHFISVFRAAVG